MGGKRDGLEWLVKHQDIGYAVPAFKHIAHQDIPQKGVRKDPQLQEDVKRFLNNGYDHIIVRSDSRQEDGKHSFAGIYDSIDIEQPDLAKTMRAVQDVLKSLNTRKARNYRAQHGIEQDDMDLILQEFIEPSFAGVMYTSNPSFPDDLIIEFSKGRNAVVDGSGETYIIEFDKKNNRRVFETDNIRHSWGFVRRLYEVGKEIERCGGPADIEFSVNYDKDMNEILALVQKRPITDLSFPEPINIPAYNPEQLIGKTEIKRGTGSITLPAVNISDIESILLNYPGMPESAVLSIVKDYFTEVINLDVKFKDGYALIIPRFDDTIIGRWAVHVDLKSTNLNEITPNKKAIITTNRASVGEHAMTVAREQGIHYTGFKDAEEMFSQVRTGNLISIYHQGREALLYLEKVSQQSLREKYSDKTTVMEQEERSVSFEADYLNTYVEILDDMQLFLDQHTQGNWKYTPWNGTMGGDFQTGTQGIHVSIAKTGIPTSKYMWHVSNGNRWEEETLLADDAFATLMEKYVQHLSE